MRDMDVDVLEEEYQRGHADGYSDAFASAAERAAELTALRIFAVRVRDTVHAIDMYGDEPAPEEFKQLLRDIAQWVPERPL